jgi:K+-sensing histidine kinase KdpD
VTPRPSSFAYGLAALLPIGAAALLVGLRDDLDPANLALCLVVVVVVAAAAGGRGPATVAALVSSVSYTFFLTAPY